jgi:hypothetical protein
MAFEWLADLTLLQYPTRHTSWKIIFIIKNKVDCVSIYVAEDPVSSVVIASFDVKLGIEWEFSVPDLSLDGIIEAGCYQWSRCDGSI